MIFLFMKLTGIMLCYVCSSSIWSSSTGRLPSERWWWCTWGGGNWSSRNWNQRWWILERLLCCPVLLLRPGYLFLIIHNTHIYMSCLSSITWLIYWFYRVSFSTVCGNQLIMGSRMDWFCYIPCFLFSWFLVFMSCCTCAYFDSMYKTTNGFYLHFVIFNIFQFELHTCFNIFRLELKILNFLQIKLG